MTHRPRPVPHWTDLHMAAKYAPLGAATHTGGTA